jgi:preprotein translocase subunit SecD
MTSRKPTLRVIQGGSEAGRIAFSLVHPLMRIDVPVREITEIEAHEAKTVFNEETKVEEAVFSPRVDVFFKSTTKEQVYRLTRAIVGQSLEIVVDGECVSRPFVLQPLCVHESGVCIAVGHVAIARTLAEQLRKGWSQGCLRAIGQ